MITRNLCLSTVAACLVLSVASQSLLAQVILVDPTTRNGSFESGTTSWSTGQGLSLTTSTVNPPGPTQGIAYGIVDKASVSNGSTVNGRLQTQNIPVDLITNGTEFSFSVDIRAADVDGFGNFGITAGFGTGPGFVGQLIESDLLTTDYVTYSGTYSAPNDSFTSHSLRFQFTRGLSTSGTTYEAYIDNLVVTQLPEPASASALGLGGLMLLLMRRSRKSRGLG